MNKKHEIIKEKINEVSTAFIKNLSLELKERKVANINEYIKKCNIDSQYTDKIKDILKVLTDSDYIINYGHVLEYNGNLHYRYSYVPNDFHYYASY